MSASQTGAWAGMLSGNLILVRQYSDGTVTAERQVNGSYTGEVTLTPEPVPA